MTISKIFQIIEVGENPEEFVRSATESEIQQVIDIVNHKMQEIVDTFNEKNEAEKIQFSDNLENLQLKLERDISSSKSIKLSIAFLKILEKINALTLDNTESAISDKITILNSELEKQKELFEEKINLLNDQIEKFDTISQNLEAKIEKQTIDHITILGIFASLIFSVFGGLQSISAVFARVGEAPLNQLLIFTGIMIISMLAIIFIGFNAVSKIAGKTISSSCDKNNCEASCNCRFHEKHPTLFYAGGLGVLVITIGFSYYIALNLGTILNQSVWDWKYFLNSSLGINIVMLSITLAVLGALFFSYIKLGNRIRSRNNDST